MSNAEQHQYFLNQLVHRMKDTGELKGIVAVIKEIELYGPAIQMRKACDLVTISNKGLWNFYELKGSNKRQNAKEQIYSTILTLDEALDINIGKKEMIIYPQRGYEHHAI